MKIVAAITMYNEILHVERQLDDCIKMGYDDIVVLDDGSTDGTWEILLKYSNKYSNIHVFKNENNSVLSKSINRWYTLYNLVKEFDPDWVHIRAADMIMSNSSFNFFKSQLSNFLNSDICVINLPIAHLWRSESWYRNDNVWGKQLRNAPYSLIYRFNKDIIWYDKHKKSGMHQGFHLPSSLGANCKNMSKNINYDLDNKFSIVVLHLGHTTHEKKCAKFNWSMQSAIKASEHNRSLDMPPPDKMPPVKNWIRFSGYKGFVEWNMDLRKAPEFWFEGNIEYGSSPKPKSLYKVIKKWNLVRAEEYKLIFEYMWGKEGDE